MSSGRLTQGVGSGLLGIEIGRNKVRLALLDHEGKTLEDVVERPIVKGGGPRDPIEEESSTRAAIEAGVERLGLTPGMPLLVGVTIGFPHCGVGSGPALRDWLADLSLELGEPIVYVGQHGVSYAPVHCIDFVRRVFEPTHLHVDRLELAPVAASRALESLRSGAITLGSGVAWSARILDRDVLEAFEIIDGAFDEVLHIVSNGVGDPIDHLQGVYVDEMMCRNRGLSVGLLAPAVGVAVALHEPAQANLLDGQYLSGPTPHLAERSPRAESANPTSPSDPQRSPSPERGWPAGASLSQPPEVDSRFDDRRGPTTRGVTAGAGPAVNDPFTAPGGGGQPGGDRYGGEAGSADQYAGDQYRSDPFARDPYGRDPYAGDQYRGEQPGGGQYLAEPAPRADLAGDIDATHRLRRLPADASRIGQGIDQGLARSLAVPPAGRRLPDDLAGIESFSPQPNPIESSDGFHVSDFLLGALLMLALVLVAALAFL